MPALPTTHRPAGATGTRSELRVATYNVHECVGSDGRQDPDRVASVVDELDADIVALQEFTYPASVALETRSPVVFTTLDQYECALGPTRHTQRQECFGNALLTRHPIVEVHRIDLSIERREPRGALAATVRINGTLVHVLAAHLGLRIRERRFQVRQILEYLDSVRNTLVVVLGDFNDWLPGRSVVHVLDRRLGQPPRPASFPAVRPIVPLDRIWVHPAEALRRVFTHKTPTARLASDHLPVVADIDTAPSSIHDHSPVVNRLSGVPRLNQ
jgi:endonuclease/exonuclease/phosphatase family metal-dependent hydrolase